MSAERIEADRVLYALSKLGAEGHLVEMGAKGLEFVTVRFGTVFGKSIGMRFHTAINKFCWQASVGQPISVWRTALHQRRPYLHVGDAVRAMHLILTWSRFDNELYNVVTSNATVNDIVEIIKGQIPGCPHRAGRFEDHESAVVHGARRQIPRQRLQVPGRFAIGRRRNAGFAEGAAWAQRRRSGALAPPHFFNPAVQFKTTVNGAEALGPTGDHEEKPFAVRRHVADDRAGRRLKERGRCPGVEHLPGRHFDGHHFPVRCEIEQLAAIPAPAWRGAAAARNQHAPPALAEPLLKSVANPRT